MSKIVISNLAQFQKIAISKPEILNIGALCCSKKAKEFGNYRTQFEAAFTVLSPADQDKLKKLLNADQLCYYVKEDNGQLKQTCF
jgi:hypothetical protein